MFFMRHLTPRPGEQGFTYVMLMITIVLMGVAMSVAARQWKTMVQRELRSICSPRVLKSKARSRPIPLP